MASRPAVKRRAYVHKRGYHLKKKRHATRKINKRPYHLKHKRVLKAKRHLTSKRHVKPGLKRKFRGRVYKNRKVVQRKPSKRLAGHKIRHRVLLHRLHTVHHRRRYIHTIRHRKPHIKVHRTLNAVYRHR